MKVIYTISRPWSPGVIEVYGEPDMGSYEWRIVGKAGEIIEDTSKWGRYGQGYGVPEVALRDALIRDTDDTPYPGEVAS